MQGCKSPIKIYSLKREDISMPVVYLIKARGHVIYVGSSRAGIIRPLHPQHHKAALIWHYFDEIEAHVFEHMTDAKIYEVEMIKKYAPPLNTAHTNNKKNWGRNVLWDLDKWEFNGETYEHPKEYFFKRRLKMNDDIEDLL